MKRFSLVLLMLGPWVAMVPQALAESFSFQVRYQKEIPGTSGKFETRLRSDKLVAEETAFIVCDVWDYHHCLNAVRRLEEFAPRLNQVLEEARRRGAVIIHAPSDCMPAYVDHPARRRATAVPRAKLPRDVEFWCSKIPTEEKAVYPIDQSDGGEDDDPTEHQQWAAKLAGLGRNPGMPWKKQLDTILIDRERDYISDRGEEVWSILEQRGIKNVVLTGVHTNMCVLGRPFGLRQMVRNGKNVVLMRDMTDCMYNPQRWPFVNHYRGNELVVSHVERFVCPTVSSDQVLGGSEFRFKDERRTSAVADEPVPTRELLYRQWNLANVPTIFSTADDDAWKEFGGTAWYRCAVRLRQSDVAEGVRLVVPNYEKAEVWLNGQKATREAIPREAGADARSGTYFIPASVAYVDDINLLVVRIAHSMADKREERGLAEAPVLKFAGAKGSFPLKGRWQLRMGEKEDWSNIPLPAKFGMGPDILFEP